jgi:hypothetical protein
MLGPFGTQYLLRDSGSSTPIHAFGGFLGSLTVTQDIANNVPPGPGGRPPKPDPILRVDIIADPRFYFGPHSSAFTITDLRDEKGQSQMNAIAPAAPQPLSGPFPLPYFVALCPFHLRQTAAKEFSLVKGTVRAWVVERYESVTVQDLQLLGNNLVDTSLGKLRVTLPAGAIPAIQPVLRLSDALTDDNSIGLSFPQPDAHQKTSDTPLSPFDLAPLKATLTNKTGSITRLGYRTGIRVPISGQGPFKLELSIPTKIAEFTLPVEFKHVPLP